MLIFKYLFTWQPVDNINKKFVLNSLWCICWIVCAKIKKSPLDQLRCQKVTN
jgi:hypothetical protein